jgi:hypothetical protein
VKVKKMKANENELENPIPAIGTGYACPRPSGPFVVGMTYEAGYIDGLIRDGTVGIMGFDTTRGVTKYCEKVDGKAAF